MLKILLKFVHKIFALQAWWNTVYIRPNHFLKKLPLDIAIQTSMLFIATGFLTMFLLIKFVFLLIELTN